MFVGCPQILLEDTNPNAVARTALDFLIFVVDPDDRPFIVHEVPPWQRPSDGGYEFDVLMDPLTGQLLTDVHTPYPGEQLDGNLGDEVWVLTTKCGCLFSNFHF